MRKLFFNGTEFVYAHDAAEARQRLMDAFECDAAEADEQGWEEIPPERRIRFGSVTQEAWRWCADAEIARQGIREREREERRRASHEYTMTVVEVPSRLVFQAPPSFPNLPFGEPDPSWQIVSTAALPNGNVILVWRRIVPNLTKTQPETPPT